MDSLKCILCIFIFPIINATFIKDIQSQNEETENLLKKVVIFDAGSTGTRAHIFTFSVAANRVHIEIKVINEDNKKIKPGLSSFATDPDGAVDSIRPLVTFSVEKVSEEERQSTPLLIKATAGLRLIPKEASEAIFRKIDEYLRKIQPGFNLVQGYSSIMSGEDEGIFGWLAVNFLLNRYDGDTVAVLDLGGGSTQVTFSPQTQYTYREGKNLKRSVKLMYRRLDLYTHSYLGYGFMQGRKKIVRFLRPRKLDKVISHPCFTMGLRLNWTFEGQTYNIQGRQGNCMNLAKRVIIGEIHTPAELQALEIYAVSSYHYVADYLGFIDPKTDCGIMRPMDYCFAAIRLCPHSNEPSSIPISEDEIFTNKWKNKDHSKTLEGNQFACLDSYYICALLRYGLGIHWNYNIHITGKINGIDSGWPLGVAVNQLYNNIVIG